MAITNGGRSLASTIVIIVLIFPEIAVQVVSQGGPAATGPAAVNVTKPTIRVDPLDHFRKYRGGFNIINKHYWSSVIFSGVYGYAIGVLWLLCGLICGVLSVIIYCCCQSDGGRRTSIMCPCGCSSCDLLPIPLVILLMILAMAAGGLSIAGSAKFNSQARSSVNTIIITANDATDIMHSASAVLKDIQGNLGDVDPAIDSYGNLESAAEKIDAAAKTILEQAKEKKHLINNGFKLVLIVTIVTISLNLVAATSLSVLGVLGLWRVLYLLVMLCWLVTIICWLLFGGYFFLENFSNDTCTALLSFQENPYNNSLSYMIPCDELLAAKSVLTSIGGGIYNLVDEVNANMSSLQGNLLPKLLTVCNPFSAPPECLYQPDKCPPDSVIIGDIPKVLRPYTCFEDEDAVCGRGKVIPGSEYEVIQTYTNAVQSLLNVYPGLEDLLGCQLVKDAFSQVLLNDCKPLKKYARMTWAGMVCLASTMVFLVVLWTLKACHEHRSHISDRSLQPNATVENA